VQSCVENKWLAARLQKIRIVSSTLDYFKDFSRFNFSFFGRQPRRKNNEPWYNDSITSSDPSSVHRVDNYNFYNRNKPDKTPSKQGDLPRALQNRSNTDNFRPTSPENRAKSPASTLSNARSLNDPRYNTLGSKPLRSNGQINSPPLQLMRSQDSASKPDYMRKKSSSAKQNSKVRHSIYTDQPSAFSQYSTPQALTTPFSQKTEFISRQVDPNGSKFLTPTNDNPNSIKVAQATSSGLEVVERNKKGYYRIKQMPKTDGRLEKIEMSIPCNL